MNEKIPPQRPDVLSVEDQAGMEGLREAFRENELLPKSMAQSADVDTSETRVPQYATRTQMQEDMDALFVEPEVGPPLPGANEPLPAVFRSNRRPKTDTPESPAPGTPDAEDPIHLLHMRGILREDESASFTPREWRNALKELIGGANEGKPDESERGKALEANLAHRSEELDTQLEKLGVVEKGFRALGERYDQYGWKTKLAVGLSLGVGAGALSTVSLPAALACLSGIAVQRAAGMASVFLKYERGAQDGKWKKEKAMGKAIAYTAAMTGAMLLLTEGVKEGIGYAREHNWGESVREWLGNALGHHSEPALTHEAVGKITYPSEAGQPAAAAAAGESAALHAPEMPVVHASAGHGYEHMMKQLWQELQQKHVSLPANADPHSDLGRLLAADASSIDKVVHQIASDPRHAFFHADGASVRIDPTANLYIGAHGELHLADSAVPISHDYTFAPPHAPVTHVPHIHTEAPAAAMPSPETPHEAVAAPTPSFASEQPPAPIETSVPHPVSHEGILVDSQGTPVVDSQGMPVHTGSYEAPQSVVSSHEVQSPAPTVEHAAPAGQSAAGSMEHIHVPVDPTTSHVYGLGDRLYAFGGKMPDDMAQTYAHEHNVSVFVDKSYKLLGFIDTPRAVEYTPDGRMIVHSGPKFTPDPKAFTRIVQ